MPRVRPWNELRAVMISYAPPSLMRPHFRASLHAPSLASAPELQKKTRSIDELSMSVLASLSCGTV